MKFLYVAGPLAFREITRVAEVLRKIRAPVEAVIFDSQGLAFMPKGFFGEARY